MSETSEFNIAVLFAYEELQELAVDILANVLAAEYRNKFSKEYVLGMADGVLAFIFAAHNMTLGLAGDANTGDVSKMKDALIQAVHARWKEAEQEGLQ